jgi:eukaryotic-like serine/threonine-protein kinase
MTASRPDNEAIFHAARDIPVPDRRRQYVREACGGDEARIAHIAALLQAAGRPDSLLDHPAAGIPGATIDFQPTAERPGTIIGPYKLLQQIGEGGMGTVFMAEQTEPVRRKVALKIIKPGMDSRQVIARFEAERQALSLMDHPNIAKVLDAGSTTSPLSPVLGGEAMGVRGHGRPFFVMELVHGVPITEFCDDHKLTPRERLALFVPVCQAIQHAHQKGIIHRDLKPSNVLVTLYDDKPAPKVIDFGVAKATEQPLTEKTLFTQFGALVGTFEYMSPEQAEMNAIGVDTRSDIYSLGVLLYELLTGTTPLERQRLRQAALDELVRLIKEEEAPRPSARLSSSNNLRKIAAARNTEPAQLSKVLKGDIDWIVMKCLEKDRTRRYESASGLARDVQRALADEPVEACPPSAGYRLRKFSRKYRTLLRVAGAFLILLVLGVVASTWQAIRATVAERAARSSEEAARSSEAEAQNHKHEADEAKKLAENRRDELAAVNDTLRRANYIADMNLAQHAWEENNLVRTRRLLEHHRPKPGEDDLRGFEWHYLNRLFHRDRLTIHAHGGFADSVVFSPDGKRLFSCGKARALRGMQRSREVPSEIKLWDATTGQRLDLALEGSTDAVRQIALSPDGTYLGAACGPAGIQVWNLATHQRFDLKSPTERLTMAVGFSPDSKRLVATFVSLDGLEHHEDVVRVYDLITHDTAWTLEGLSWLANRYDAPAFSPDGKYLAIVHFLEGRVRVVEAATGREAFSFEATVDNATFSPDGKSLAIGGRLGVTIWDVATHQQRLTCQNTQNTAPDGTRLGHSPDGKQLAISGVGVLIGLWDTRTGQQISTFKGHAGSVRSITFCPDGKYLASAGFDGTVRLWDTTSRGDVIPLFKELKRPGDIDFSPDGQALLVEDIGGGGDLEDLFVADATTGRRRGEQIHFDSRIDYCFDWTADGKHLIGPGDGKTVLIYDTGTGALVHSFPVDREDVCATAITPDGRWFAHSAPAATIKIRDAETGAERRALRGLADQVRNLAFDPDGSHLAGTDTKGWLRVWDVATGQECMSVQIQDMSFSRLRFNPDGKQLAIVGNNFGLNTGDVRILDAATGREILQLAGHTSAVSDVAFSPDGQRLATGTLDRTIRIWHARTGQEILTLRGHTQRVGSVRFVSGGHRLISASADQTIRVWDATPLPE